MSTSLNTSQNDAHTIVGANESLSSVMPTHFKSVGNTVIGSTKNEIIPSQSNSLDSHISNVISSGSNHNRVPDGGFGWVIVVASFLASMISDGICFSYGVLTTEYIKEYKISRFVVGLMNSMLFGITLGSGPVVSVICSRLGYRLTSSIGSIIAGIAFALPFFYSPLWFLILTSCVICGFGLGMVYLPSIVIINEWFDSRRSLAMGIAFCGSGLGAFVFSPIMEEMLICCGWRLTMLIMGGVILLIVPLAAVYVLPKREPGEYLTTEPVRTSCPSVQSTVFSAIMRMLQSQIFLLFALSNLITSIGFFSPLTFIKDRSILKGFSTKKSSFLISTIGIGNCIGRVVFGFLGSTSFCHRFHMYNWSLIIAGLSLIFSFLVTSYSGCVFYTLVYGLFSGAYVTLTPVVIVDMFNHQGGLSIAFGLINIFQAIGVLCGPSLIGRIFDQTKSYDIAFGVSGIMITFSGLMLYLAYASDNFRTLDFKSTKVAESTTKTHSFSFLRSIQSHLKVTSGSLVCKEIDSTKI